MQALDKRITAIEQATYRSDTVVIIRYDTPGELSREIFNLEGDCSESLRQHWTRRTDETEQVFTDRASKEVTRNRYGVATLFQCD